MREKYKSLSLAVLRELAKARGMKGISTLKKEQLIDRMVQQDEIDQAAKQDLSSDAPASAAEKSQTGESAKQETGDAEAVRQEPETEKLSEKADSIPALQPANEIEKPVSEAEKPVNEAESRRPRSSVYNNGGYSSGYNNVQSNSNNQENRRRATTYNGLRNDRNSMNGYNSAGRTSQNRNQERNGDRNTDRYAQERSQDRIPQKSQDRYNNQDRYAGQNRSNNQDRYQDRSNNQDRYQDRTNTQDRYAGQDRGNNQEPNLRDSGYTRANGPLSNSGMRQGTAAAQQRVQQPQTPVYDAEAEERMREADAQLNAVKEDLSDIDSGNMANGILEILTEGYGFIRSANYLPGDNDVYVSPSQIRRFNLKTGDIVCGNTRIKTEKEKFSALLYVTSVNGYHPSEAQRRPNFEDLTPIFPDQRLLMERPGGSVATRVVDLLSPIGKGQRGMIVSPPKAGKTTLLKEIAKSITYNNPEMKLIILLIDERPEEVTDIKEAIEGDQVEVIYSTFDETPEHHKRVSEMVIERAKRLVEHRQDVIILLDSITRLARAYNLTVPPSGRTLSGGLDPAALHMPKRFFGAARNMRGGGSLTILATALVETGSKMDDVVFEEFKGTGNMELVLDRKLSEKRIFPAIDMAKSGTRRDDLLLTEDEMIAVENMRRSLNGLKPDDAVETILNIFSHTHSNAEVVASVRNSRII